MLQIKYFSLAKRDVEAGLRGAMVRRLQQLSIGFHKEMAAGKIQSKVMRDVEAIEALAKKVAQALDENEGAPLVVAGGVAANSHIRARLSSLCKKMGRKMHVPPLSLCGDNAAMIAAEGYYRYRSGALADSTLNGSAAD